MIFLTGTAPPGETEPQRRARVLLELEERQRQLAVEIAEQTLKTATSGAKAARADASMKTAAAKVQRETDQRRDADVERNPIPDSLILTNMPVTYSAAQLRAGLMGFLAPTLDDQGNPLLICDLSTTSPHAKGAVSMLARGVKNLLNRCREQEVKLAGPLFPGTEKSGVVPMREVTVDDVAGVILTLMYNTTVNISKFKHRFIGFNPDEDRSRFFQVFNQEGLTAEVDGVIKSMVEKKLKPPQPGKPIKPLEGYSAAVDAELTLTIGVELGLTGADATDPSKIQAKWASMDVAARDEFMKGKPKKGRTAAVPKLSVRLRKLAVLPPEPDAGTELTPAYLEQCEQARSMQGVFSEAEAVIKITPIEGVLHRPKNREKAMGKSLGEVTVADAMAFALWDHETGGHSSEAINTEVALAIKKKLSEMFTYVSFDGGDGKIRDAITALERDGVVFNRHLTELFGWMARDTALRVHDRYLAITKRLPPKRRALRNAYVIGAEAPDAQAKAHAQIDIYHDAHRVTLEEFRDRPDLTVYEADMVMAAHKGWDDMFIQKESIFGIGNPQWKFDFCRQACEEFFLDLRDHEDVRPNFQKETENQRRIANKMWARYNNEIVCDAQGNPVNGARIKRDADSQDIIVEGIGTLNTSTYGYVKRTWGDDKSGLNNVRGYNYTINTVWDCRQVSDLVGEGHRLLLAVNQGREQRIRHVDEISAADLTDDVIARFNNGYLPGFLPGLTPTAIYVRGERQLRTMALAQSRTADGVITHEFNEHIRTNATSIIDAEATSQLTDEGVAINPSNISARVNQLTQQARTHGLDNVGFARSIYIRDTINGEAREQLLLEHHVADQQSISQRARDLTKKAADQNMNEEMLAKAIYRDHRVRELGRSSEIVVTEAQAAEDLAKRVARTRLEHDIKRGTYIYMFTLFVKSRIMHSPDVELRHRCVFRNGMADPTAYEMLDNELYQLSRMPPNAELAQDDPRRLIVDGREATDEEQARIRKYAFALYKFPADAVHRIFYATD